MRERLITNKQAADILNMPVSTFNEKRAEFKLTVVQLYPGRKGRRLIEREVVAIQEKAIANAQRDGRDIRRMLRLEKAG